MERLGSVPNPVKAKNMTRRIALMAGCLLTLCPTAFAATYYVSPTGSDNNPGTEARPFATLVRARDAIRDMKRQIGLPDGGVTVMLRGGRYFLEDALVLTPQDSGTQESPIVYSAYPGERVVVSGGRPITGWKQVGDNLWSVELPEVKAGKWYFRQLFADGDRKIRARSPNKGFFMTRGPLSKYAELARQGEGRGGWTGTYKPFTVGGTEPLSADGDLDCDGFTNKEEYDYVSRVHRDDQDWSRARYARVALNPLVNPDHAEAEPLTAPPLEIDSDIMEEIDAAHRWICWGLDFAGYGNEDPDRCVRESDMDGNGIPDGCDLAVVGAVLSDASHPLHAAVTAAYRGNLASLAKESTSGYPCQEFVAAMLLCSQDSVDWLMNMVGGGSLGWGGFEGIRALLKSHPEAYCGFNFAPGDIEQWSNIEDVEIITWHSWECSWQTIKSVDTITNDVYFNTPCRYPVGFFSNRCRYRAESFPEALDEPGEWYLDRKRGALSYLAKPGEDPSRMEFIAPVIKTLVVLRGDPAAGEFVKHVRFSGLSFQHTQYPMGMYDVAPDWPADALAVYPDWPEKFRPGYTDSQAAPRCGQTIELRDARDCVIEGCEFASIGAYAIKMGERCHHNSVVGCKMHDLGGGGVLIGLLSPSPVAQNIPREDVPSHNLVSNNVIQNGGVVHPSAVAVWVGQAHHNTVAHNEISHFPYSGISCGWTWSRAKNYSDNNIIEYNHIHHVLQELADGGGIYTLGVLTGGVLRGNYIHDIARSKGAIGGWNNGIFFDEGSKDLLVERNVIHTVVNEPIRFNGNTKEDHTWVDNAFGVLPSDPEFPRETVAKAGLEPKYRETLVGSSLLGNPAAADE